MKRALITGVAGQDGSYLAELLLEKGYEVFGLTLPDVDRRFVPDAVKILIGDLMDDAFLKAAAQASQSDEVYHLAGVTDLKTAYESPELTWRLNHDQVGAVLEACRSVNPSVRFFQASSSEIFVPSATLLDEDAAREWQTKNPYASAKMSADRDFIQASRETRGVYACSAFLFNHESPRRSERSVLRKIARSFAKIHLGLAETLEIGNVELARDWGFAGDYVEAMWKMLQRDTPDDFVIASGQAHTVKDAIDLAAQHVGIRLSWEGEGLHAQAHDHTGKRLVSVSLEFYKPTEPYTKVGDISKAKRLLGWKPSLDFPALIEMMVKADLEDLQSGKSGHSVLEPQP